MIARVLLICLSAFLVGGVGLYGASRKEESAVQRIRLTKFVVYFCIVNLFLLCALAGPWALGGLVTVIVALGAREIYAVLFRASGRRPPLAIAMGAIYVLIAAFSVLFVWSSLPIVTVFVYLIVCAFDGFSQVAGQLFGKHHFAPKISPGKTIEGSVGGLLFAIVMAMLLRPVVAWSLQRTLLACCFIVLTALAGDLLASILKRKSGVKDFSNLLPGHGGILDRFDSFLLATAACLIAGIVSRGFAPLFR